MKLAPVTMDKKGRIDPQWQCRSAPSRAHLLLAMTGMLAVLAVLHLTHRLDSDEGVILNGAWNLLNGRVLYTDFFEFVAPGGFYLVFAAWKLAGPEFWVAKALGVGAIAVAAGGVYRMGELLTVERKVAARCALLLPGPFVLCLFSGYWPAINHNTFAIAPSVWSVFFMTRALIRRSRTDAAVAGLLCGVATVFLQHRGALIGMAELVGLMVFARRDRVMAAAAAAFLLGAALPVIGVLGFWPLALLKEYLIDFPSKHYLAANRTDLSLFLFVTAIVGFAAWLLRGICSRSVGFLLPLQAVLLVSTLQRPDLSHVTASLFPLLALLPLLLSTASGALMASKTLVLGGLFVLTSLLPFTVPGAVWRTDFFEPSSHPAMAYVRDSCTASPYLHAGPFAPGYYYETRKLNPSRYSILLTGLHTARQFEEALDDISARRPECIVTNYATAEKFGYSQLNIIDGYVKENYRIAFEKGLVQVWRRKGSTTAVSLEEDPRERE